jgi:hypothetical protein
MLTPFNELRVKNQSRRFLDFLKPITDQPTNTDRFVKYFETWTKLQGKFQVQYDMWNANETVHHAYKGNTNTVQFWRTLGVKIATEFDYAIRASPDNAFHEYNDLLKKHVNELLNNLLKYIRVYQDYQDPADLLYEEALDLTARSFMDVVLFLFAIPNLLKNPRGWDLIEDDFEHMYSREFNLKRDACEFYQGRNELMNLLGDCTVVVLLTGHFELPPGMRGVIARYTVLALPDNKYNEYFEIPLDTLASIRIMQNGQEEILQPCIACTEKTRDVIIIPCNHCVFCHECVSKSHSCPMCRGPIEDIVSVKYHNDITGPIYLNTQFPKQSVCSLLKKLSGII